MKLMKKMKRALALTCAVAMVVTSLQGTATVSKAAEATKIAILSTTDMHGKCWGTNILNDEKVKNSMLKVSTVLKGIRTDYNNNVVLIDNGDSFQGTPVSSLSIMNATPTAITVETPMAMIYKYLHYDAFVLGNHEFNYSWETMNKVYQYLESNVIDVNNDGTPEPSVPVLAANIVYEKDDQAGHKANQEVFKPYTTKDFVIDGQSFKVGILGLENMDCTRWDIPDNYPNMRFAHLENKEYSMAYEAQMNVDKMKAEGCDYIITSYHSGLGTADGELKFGVNTENQILRVIANTTGIDMIIAGHDHSSSYSDKEYEGKDGKKIRVVNGGGNGLTKTELQVTATGAGQFDVKTIGGTNIDLGKKDGTGELYANDAELEKLVQPFASGAALYVNQVCGTVNDAGWDNSKTAYYLEQTDVMDLVNRAQISSGEVYLKKEYSDPDKFTALQAKYGPDYKLDVDLSSSSVVINKDTYTGIQPGTMTLKDIYKFYKYDNNLYVIPVKGYEIKQILEFVAAKRLAVTFKGGKAVFETAGDSFTNPVFYGLDFTYDLAKPIGKRVAIRGFKNGKGFDKNKYYNLAVNNYHVGNGPFSSLATSDAIWSQTDNLGGGNIQDLIKLYVETASGSAIGGIVPDRSNWNITYSGKIPVEAPTEPNDSFDPIPDATFAANYPGALNVKEAAAEPENSTKEITVVGQVTACYDGRFHIIQDVVNKEVAGYCVYDKDTSHQYTIGDIISIKGTSSPYGGLPEMKPSKGAAPIVLDSLGKDLTIAPQVITAEEFMKDKSYVNETVVFQNIAFDPSKVADSTGSVEIYSAVVPKDFKKGEKVDFYGVGALGFGKLQLRNSTEADFVRHTTTYDPVPDSLLTSGMKSLKEVRSAAENEKVITVAQVAYKPKKNNFILQDIVGGEIVGIHVYDKTNEYNIGDVVEIEGIKSTRNDSVQIKATTVRRIKTDIAFQPQDITIKEISPDYFSEYIRLSDVTLGKYNGGGGTPLTDKTGKINAQFAPAYPAGTAENSVVGIKGAVDIFKGTLQLSLGSSFSYLVKTVMEKPIADKTYFRLPVVETSDVHGFLLDVSSGKEEEYQYRMAYIADKVNDLRQNSDVLLLDGGDIYQGNPVSNLLMGAPMTAAMDAMKYDAVALGNHEFDWGVTKLLDNDGTMGSYNLSNSEGSAVGNSKIPVVCANMFDAKTNERVNFTKDYVILDKKVKSLNGVSGTIKVAVFGYVDDYSKDIMAAQIAPYKIDETKLKEIEDQARKMEDAGLVDASVVLAHAGANSIAEEFVTGGPIDLVLGGHTHQSVCGVATNGVAYAQPKNQAQDYAYTEICMDPITKEIYVENNETKTVYSKTTKEVLYNTEKNAAELDAEVVKISKIASKEVAPTMNQKLGTITKQVTKGSISGNKFSSTAGNFMTELQNAATGAKISFTNGGGIRTEFTFDTPVRMLTAGDIYTIAPFCNTLPTFELTYSEVLDLVKYAVGAGESLSLRMGGATAYYSEKGEVTTLFIGDKLVYADGQYQNGHSALEKVIVCTNEYVATAKGTPFASKKSIETLNGKTPATDNEAFIAALKIEAMYNDGNIYVNP
ncbi:MAG: 5'-nucleotidase C-terminal domain-containing protein, partial [Acetivibrio sp.]